MADYRIKVSVEELKATIARFRTCKDELQNAYQRMDSAVTVLNSSWNGEASEAFFNKYGELARNVHTSDPTMEQAIIGLEKAAEIYEETEATASAIGEGMTDAPAFQG